MHLRRVRLSGFPRPLAASVKALNVLAKRTRSIVLPVPANGIPRGDEPSELATDMRPAERVPRSLELVQSSQGAAESGIQIHRSWILKQL